MPHARHHRRLAAWVTVVALVLATLAPGAARALSFVQSQIAPWTQVCSADDSGRQPGPSGGHAGEVQHPLGHCPLCSLHGDDWTLPPAPAALGPVPALRQAVPALFLHAPRPLHAWTAPPPRGPPPAA